MKHLFLLLLLSFNVNSAEYQIDVGYTQIEHAWRGPDNVATYKPTMTSTGFTYILDSGIAARVGYGTLDFSETKGKYSDLVLEMDYILSFELMYRHNINNFTIYGGLGRYVIPASVRAKSTDYFNSDYDNDEGYFFGAEYKVYKDVSIGARFNMMSRIKKNPYDEWTKGIGVYVTYDF